MHGAVDMSPRVKSALNSNKPVVALESCVISHGLPAKENTATAIAMEKIIRDAGAEPATIAVLGGRIKIGLSEADLEQLAKGPSVKLAARDLPGAVVKGLNGGTTVSATARIAGAFGMFVVCTGGIGGVHFGSAESGDVSADLWELTHTPVTVVCSGPKAVVDAAQTAEWLESHSVPVYGYLTDELPAFYAGSTGIKIPRVDNADEFAEIVRTSRAEFGVSCALLLAVPPDKKLNVDVNEAVRQALREAGEQGIGGRDVTPYLLERVSALTKGASLQSNVALLKNNARVAAEIACALFKADDRRAGFVS